MPLIKRSIPATTDLASPQLYEASSNDTILNSVGFSNMTGVLHQLSQLADFSSEIFQDLFTVSKQLSGRLAGVKSRLSRVNTMLEHNQTDDGQKRNQRNGTEEGRTARFDEISQQLFTPSSRDKTLCKLYADCTPPPSLDLLDEYVDLQRLSQNKLFFRLDL